MDLSPLACTNCGAVQFTLAADKPCSHASTFHSWTRNREALVPAPSFDVAECCTAIVVTDTLTGDVGLATTVHRGSDGPPPLAAVAVIIALLKMLTGKTVIEARAMKCDQCAHGNRIILGADPLPLPNVDAFQMTKTRPEPATPERTD